MFNNKISETETLIVDVDNEISFKTSSTDLNVKLMSFQKFKDLIYNNPDPFKRNLITWDRKTYRETFLEMLEQMKKLTKLSNALKSYDAKDRLSYVQPEFNDKQQFRCYFSNTYVVVEVNPKPSSLNSGWSHIIENHWANEIDSENKYEHLKIMRDLDEDVWKIVCEGIKMCVRTVEEYLYSLSQNQPPVYEQMKLIRLVDPDEEKIKSWAKAVKMFKEEEKANRTSKTEKKKNFWKKLFGLDDKISFS